jgi:hypothetical protein
MLSLTDKTLRRFKKILKDEECASYGIGIFYRLIGFVGSPGGIQ